ncbi:MAG: sugar ABC transporter permease [Atribacterota bacterium]
MPFSKGLANLQRGFIIISKLKNHSELNINYLKISPLLVVVSLFTIYPVIYAISISLREYKLILPPPYEFIGFENYITLFKDRYFLQALSNTCWFVIICVISVVILGFFSAQLLNKRFKGVGILRVLVFLPWTIPYVTVGILWKLFFMSGWGYFTKILNTMGIFDTGQSVAWLANGNFARFAVVLAQVWHEFPLATIFLLSGMQTIPGELYEAIEMDSGKAFDKIRYITIPLLKPVFVIVIVLNAMMALITFDVVYVITGGGPAGKTSLISYYAYTKAFKFLNFGESGATSIVLSIFTIVFVLIIFKITAQKREVGGLS